MSAQNQGFRISRRGILQLGVGAAVAAPFAGLLTGCSGASTSGGGEFNFLSTQFTPVEEKQRFEKILADNVTDPKVSFSSMAVADFTTQVKTQVDAKKLSFGMVGGLHGDLSPLGTYLEDIDSLVDVAKKAGINDAMLKLGQLGGNTAKYIPWMQATYVVAVNKKALEWLPSGADVNSLTYDQYLEWAKAAKAANGGKAVFGHPAGPKGLHHRFYQGYLLPSFTGAQLTQFTSPDAVTAWEYMAELWQNINPASTNYDNMQEPLARGEVLVAWDHVARLVEAPKENPDEWIMVPSPTGPKGLGYMLVVAGLAVPKGGDVDEASKVIEALLKPEVQLETLRQNAFFPVVTTDLPDDLPAPVRLEADAVAKQAAHPDAVVALPPVGLGAKDGEVSQAFKDCFREICLNGADVKTTIDAQAAIIQKILDELKVPCWAPDPEGPEVCSVG